MSGDRETATKLFLRHRETALAYIRALVRNAHDADELFQEVGLTALDRDEPPCEEAMYPGWLRGVARNVVLHYWRTKRRRHVIPDDRLLGALDVAYQESDEDGELAKLRSAALAECLRQASGRSRELLSLRFESELTSEEIARRSGRTPGAVRKELSRLYASLLDCVRRRADWDEDHELRTT